jgi:hypothetical protein
MVNILLGLVVVGVILVGQLTVRPVREDSRMVLVLGRLPYGYGVMRVAS